MDIRGDPIVFCGGAFIGKTGWIDNSKPSTGSNRVAVIVQIDDHGGIKTSKVERENIRRTLFKPSSYAEACVYEHHELKAKMKAFCTHFAKCGITIEDVDDAKSLFATNLFHAINKQQMKGKKANCLVVSYKRPSKKHNRNTSPTRASNSKTAAKAAAKADAAAASASSKGSTTSSKRSNKTMILT